MQMKFVFNISAIFNFIGRFQFCDKLVSLFRCIDHISRNCIPLYCQVPRYLSNRKQRVVVNGCESHLVYINAGVPQGSIYGQLFFLVFIKDIILELETNPYFFADETFMLDIFSKFPKLC